MPFHKACRAIAEGQVTLTSALQRPKEHFEQRSPLDLGKSTGLLIAWAQTALLTARLCAFSPARR